MTEEEIPFERPSPARCVVIHSKPRREILRYLHERGGKASKQELIDALGIPRESLEHHLKVLLWGKFAEYDEHNCWLGKAAKAIHFESMPK
jgi:DNA-binding transcriptional ArsR family regulator